MVAERDDMENDDQPTDEGQGEESFEALLEKSIKKQGRLDPGQMVEAVIVKITAEWIFLDLGGKGEGYLDRKELLDASGALTVREGDRVRAYFLSAGNNELHFTTKIGSGPAGHGQLEDAWRSGVPVEGTIAKEVKGGFEVRIGGMRAFCPFSQTGMRREERPADAVGRSLSFKIMEYGEGGRNIVLSRRVIVEAEQREKREVLKETLTEGMRVKGTVTSLQKFGAFVDIGGLEGLLPVSEIAWSRTEKASDVLTKGQEVEVIIKKIDWQQGRFSFSLKDALPDPWEHVARDYPPGSYHSGKVVRLAAFGAFVDLGAGVDGLIHISKLGAGKRISHPREALKEGQAVEVKIETVDGANKKLSLSLAEAGREEEEAAATLQEYRNQAAAPQNMGTLGELLKAKLDDGGKRMNQS